MGSGIIILSIIALLFLGMYLYAYGTTKFSIRREKRARQKKLHEMEKQAHQREIEKQERIKIREENSRLAEARSNLIKKEIARLEEMKKKHKV